MLALAKSSPPAAGSISTVRNFFGHKVDCIRRFRVTDTRPVCSSNFDHLQAWKTSLFQHLAFEKLKPPPL